MCPGFFASDFTTARVLTSSTPYCLLRQRQGSVVLPTIDYTFICLDYLDLSQEKVMKRRSVTQEQMKEGQTHGS